MHRSRLGAVLFLLWVGVTAAHASKEFAVETVIVAPDDGEHVSIDVATDGLVWIAYGGYFVRFMYGTSGRWNPVTTEYEWRCSPRSAVVLEPDDLPGIFCSSGYVHWVGNDWKRSYVAANRPGFHIGWYHSNALAVGVNGTVVTVAVHDYAFHHPSQELYHTLLVAERSNEEWTLVDLGGPPFVPRLPLKIDVAVDTMDDVHVGVVPTAAEEFRYYKRTEGRWSWEYLPQITVDFALASDHHGVPWIAYADEEGLWVARREALWERTLVVVDATATSPDMVIDPNNVPHIVFQTNTQLGYATLDAEGAWQFTFIDDARVTSSGISVTADGVPHIVFHDGDSQELRYATPRETTPVQPTHWSTVKNRYRK